MSLELLELGANVDRGVTEDVLILPGVELLLREELVVVGTEDP